MTKAFLVAMVILTFAAFGVVGYKLSTDAISVEGEAGKISPASLNRSIPDSQTPDHAAAPDDTGNQTDTCINMGYEEAKEIALASECGAAGKLLDVHYCNTNTATWWIDMDIEKTGCSPACVVNVAAKTAEINWRCTGAILPDAAPAPADQTRLKGTTNPEPANSGTVNPGKIPPAGGAAPISN